MFTKLSACAANSLFSSIRVPAVTAAHLFAKGDVATSNVQNVELLRNVLRHCRNASVPDALWSSGSFRKPNVLESSVVWVSKAVFARLGVVRRVQANGSLLVTALCFLSSVDVSEFHSGLFPSFTQSKNRCNNGVLEKSENYEVVPGEGGA